MRIQALGALLSATLGLCLAGCDREVGSVNALGPAQARATPVTPAPAVTATRPGDAAVAIPHSQTPEYLVMVPALRPPQRIALLCPAVTAEPTLDGQADDPAWKTAPAIQTRDYSSQRPITLQSVHTGDRIFFLVTYPDAAPSTTHKSWVWDEMEEVYKPMGDREDILVLKWSQSGNDVNLSFRDAEPHHADIWFWKAARTNPTGYADDKWQELVTAPGDDSLPIASPKHGTLSLVRRGDAGKAAYAERIPMEYRGKVVANFTQQQPDGSRADVRAKGARRDGLWTIEFARNLQTGQSDDVQFQIGGNYLFGVSCYELAHTGVDPDCYQPLYKTGDVFDRLTLQIEQP